MEQQLYRQMNALVRTQEQRDNILTQLQINNGQALEGRHDPFYLENNKVMYNLPNGDIIKNNIVRATKKELQTKQNNIMINI